MLKIRLTRVGKKNSPAYRVVVADQRKAVKGKFIEIIGHYNPTLKPKEIKIDKERSLFWIEKGAQISDTVKNLMCDLGILAKKDKVNKIYGKPTKKKDNGKEPEATKPAETENAEAMEDEKVEEAVEEINEETPAEEEEAKEAETETETKDEPEVKAEDEPQAEAEAQPEAEVEKE